MTARPKVRCPLTAKTPSARFNCLIFLSFSLCSSPLYSFSLVLHTSLPLLSLLPLIPLCSFSLSSFSRPPLLSVYSLSSFSPLCSFSLALHPFSLSFLSSLSVRSLSRRSLVLLSSLFILSRPSLLSAHSLSRSTPSLSPSSHPSPLLCPFSLRPISSRVRLVSACSSYPRCHFLSSSSPSL
eukprot:TRINITY_DN2015_c0_g1_i7.p4 TRINITY_DN2015_c0_g1~~TRINITY_DN2015_c0_g1_i7.p4  ORF type:complete len:182 (+),score=55.89 TRINITY_DN2015_c0_g1_i7:2999-3544(+)